MAAPSRPFYKAGYKAGSEAGEDGKSIVSSRGAPPSYCSRVSSPVGKGETVRLLVRLSTGTNVCFMVSPTCTVGDLRAMAVERSCGLGVKCGMENTMMANVGGYEERFCDEDRIESVMGWFYNKEVVELKSWSDGGYDH